MFHGLSVKEYINEHLNDDTDYWYIGMGADYVLTQLYNYSAKDWIELEVDVRNWDDEALEILIIVLSHKESFYRETNKISFQRSRVFAQIFDSVDVSLAYDFLDELWELLEFPNWDIELLYVVLNKLNIIKESVADDPIQAKAVSKIEEKLKAKIEAVEK
ncbi:MAG: hypothetical protein R3279_10125 [Putridiphycobacter sp.]|nr:hypothetical protein [Putridiphycobacter sp.]